MLNSIPVVEIFGEPGKYAIQGEGKFAGTPSVFVRTFGCNLRCAFGLNNDTQLKESYEKQIRKYPSDFPDKTLEELPIFDKYCDTYYSIFSEYRKYTQDYTVVEMYEELKKRTNNFNTNIHIVITGGEPLLPEYQHFWKQVFNMMDSNVDDYNYVNVTFETNGTYPLVAYFNFDYIITSFSISPKLKNSGQSYFKTIKPNAVRSYIECENLSWFKFVVNSEDNISEIKKVLEMYGLKYTDVYLMPEGGTKKEIEKHDQIVYNLCSKYGFKYSPRLQVTILNNLIGN